MLVKITQYDDALERINDGDIHISQVDGLPWYHNKIGQQFSVGATSSYTYFVQLGPTYFDNVCKTDCEVIED